MSVRPVKLFEKLPDTFEEYVEQIAETEAAIIVKGDTVQHVDVKPDQFAAWCEKTGKAPSMASLMKYAGELGRAQEGKLGRD